MMPDNNIIRVPATTMDQFADEARDKGYASSEGLVG